MVKKLVGYIITGIGLLGILVTSFPPLKAAVPGLDGISNMALTIGSIVILAVGILLILKVGSKKEKVVEVPIYHGKKIVGYRRHAQK